MTVVKRVVAATLLGGAVASSLLGAGAAAALPGDQGGDGTGWQALYNGVPGCMHVGEQIPPSGWSL